MFVSRNNLKKYTTPRPWYDTSAVAVEDVSVVDPAEVLFVSATLQLQKLVANLHGK